MIEAKYRANFVKNAMRNETGIIRIQDNKSLQLGVLSICLQLDFCNHE